jgi:hypothetical protein
VAVTMPRQQLLLIEHQQHAHATIDRNGWPRLPTSRAKPPRSYAGEVATITAGESSVIAG